MFKRLLDFRGSIASWFILFESLDWFDWEGDSPSVGSEMVRCSGAPGLSTLGRAFLCLNSEEKKQKLLNTGREGLCAQRTCDSLYFPCILMMSFELSQYIQRFDCVKRSSLLFWDNKNMQCQSML